MKNLLIIIIGIIVICSFLIITNNVMGEASYNTPEALQSRIDYNQKIIWGLENKYRTRDPNRMYPRDRQRYINAKRDLSKAIAEYNNLIKRRQYKQKGYYYTY
jgi:hypothetical protein